MKDKVDKRLQELSSELDKLITSREDKVAKLKAMDVRIRELSAVIVELNKLLSQLDDQENAQNL